MLPLRDKKISTYFLKCTYALAVNKIIIYHASIIKPSLTSHTKSFLVKACAYIIQVNSY